jgi:hypothetical protein
VQVVTAVGGPALSGITAVNVSDAFLGTVGGSACAIGAAGAVWCWGSGARGQLGTGSLNDSSFAVPVLTSAGGGQFTGAKQLSVSPDHACALKNDNTLWCWGDNQQGQIGNGDTSMQTVFYPAQVANLSNTVATVVATTFATCATTTDGTAWCWGPGWALGNGSGATAYVPGQVLTAPATPLTQVAKIVDFGPPYYTKMCALETDETIWCWGADAGPAYRYASHFSDNTNTPIANVTITGRDCLLDSSGSYYVPGPGPADNLMTIKRTSYALAPCP